MGPALLIFPRALKGLSSECPTDEALSVQQIFKVKWVLELCCVSSQRAKAMSLSKLCYATNTIYLCVYVSICGHLFRVVSI